MRIQPALLFFGLFSVSVSQLIAQDPLDEMYGQAVHSYYRGDLFRAEELLNEVIGAGSQDPRAYYFRGLCQSRAGLEAGTADFERAAQMEMEGKKVVNVGKALERIQGPARIEIEKARSKARLMSRARLLELQRSRYDEMQRAGDVPNGIIVPPLSVDPAPSPNALAPNDPFNQGLTKGEPKVIEGEKPATETTTDPLMPLPTDPTPPPATEPEDPFK
jgi:hypothetical protein